MKEFCSTQVGGTEFRWGEKTYVMGIINMTPDSFSGDGLGNNVDAAVLQALRMEKEGADLIDVGGESTRPKGATYGAGAEAISAEEELHRVLPVIRALKKALTIPISIDTYKAEVAERAIAEGAALINDVWGLRRDSRLAEVAAASSVPLVITHNKENHDYADFVPEVFEGLRRSIEIAVTAGVQEENIIIDPGIGFGKTAEHNLELLRHLEDFKKAFRYPLLLGTSRKNFIGLVLGGLLPEDRVEGTMATIAVAITHGVDIVRVHDVKEAVRTCRMTDAIMRGWVRED